LAVFSLAVFLFCNVCILIIGLIDIIVHRKFKIDYGGTIPMGSSPYRQVNFPLHCFLLKERDRSGQWPQPPHIRRRLF